MYLTVANCLINIIDKLKQSCMFQELKYQNNINISQLLKIKNFQNPCSHEKGDTGAVLGLTDDNRRHDARSITSDVG